MPQLPGVSAEYHRRMTLVVSDVDAARPQTHALAIGVGEYEHLPGGDGDTTPFHGGLGQLGSPVPSALAFADWVCTRLANPSAPLGSLELLLSPAGQAKGRDGAPIAVESAGIEAIERAVERWFARCNARPDNVACFYFCGHGVMRTRLTLLARDFGASALNPFAQALDFEKLRLGMGRCAAGTQLFFVDACRQIPIEARELLDLDAAVPVPPLLSAPQRSDHLVLSAAAPGERAYGVAGQPGRFTRALLEALGGLAARRERGRWQVGTADLGLAVVRALERLAAAEGAPAQAASPEGSPRGAVVHVLPGAPEVPLDVEIAPEEAAPHVTVRVVCRDGKVASERAAGPGARWSTRVAAGLYDLAIACAPGSGWKDAVVSEVPVLPPGDAETVEVPNG
jgi:hypothetical protein